MLGKVFGAVLRMGLAGAIIAGAAITDLAARDILLSSSQGTVADSSKSIQVDYNCAGPGHGSPWLKHAPGYSYRAPAPQSGPYYAGFFTSGGGYQLFLPVQTMSGVPVSIDDVYRMLCRFHPQLGGSGLRLMTNEEIHSYGYDWEYADEFTVFAPEYYTDDLPLAASEASMADGQTIRIYWLPDMPDALLRALRTGTSPLPGKTEPAETRVYRVVVNGYENKIPNPGQTTPNGVRFDYRLVGEFTIERTNPSGPWKVASSRITTGDVSYRSLYPADQYQLELSCQYGSCERLRHATRLFLQVRGDEVIVSWGYFYPYVRLTGTCTDCPGPVDRYHKSDDFFARINSTTVPLKNLYVGPRFVAKYSNGEVQVSFAYELKLLSEQK